MLAKPETATDTTATSTSYYSYGYGRNQDEKTDSGTITLNINPTNIFSLNPSYDVRRTLERREDRSYLASDTETASETQEETKPDFSIAEREHRLSFTPRLNRDLIGLRPTVTSRMSFRENWFREQKNASLNGNVSLGMNLSVQKWFGWFLKTEKPPEIQTPVDGPQNGTPPSLEIEDPPESPQTNDATKRVEQLRENGIDETQIQELEEDRGDWIERDKGEVVNGEAQANVAPVVQEGILHRVLKSFTISTNANFTATESYRQACIWIVSIRDLVARG